MTGVTGTTGATGPRGPSDAYVSSFGGTMLSTTLATIGTLTLPATGTYLVWVKASLTSQSAAVRNVGCYLTTGANGTLDGAFELSQTQINANAQAALPLQGELFVETGNGTTVRLQCEQTLGSDVLATGEFQAVKVASVTLSS